MFHSISFFFNKIVILTSLIFSNVIMTKTIVFIQAVLAFVLISQSASALGISSASFPGAEQGRSYTQTVTLMNSQNDFDNHFVIGIDGEIKTWIKVSPVEFDLKKGEIKLINITLIVPEDSKLGEVTGTITAVGRKTVPSSSGGEGATVGYAVATKGNIYANVLKQGALASVEITGVEVSSHVVSGSVARFTVNSRNNGNVATSANFKLEVKKDEKVIASVPDTKADFTLGEEKNVKLFWDTQGVEDGKYNAYIKVTTIASGMEKTSAFEYKPVLIIIGNTQGISSTILIAVAGLIILIIAVFLVLRNKK